MDKKWVFAPVCMTSTIFCSTVVPSSPQLRTSDGIQRKYRRSHRQPIPLLDEKNMLITNKLACSNKGCENHPPPQHEAFNFSVLVECWKCKPKSSPGASSSEYKIGNVQLFVNLIFILYARWHFKIVCLQTKLASLAICKKI